MKFKREVNNNSFVPTFKYRCQDDLFAAEIYQAWHPSDTYSYNVVLEFDRSCIIAESSRKKIKRLKDAKALVIKIFELLHRANTNGELWIAKGVQIGFTDISEMEHLKPID